MTYQKKTGTLSQGAHPGSYNGQDAYNDMLVTVPEREREHGASGTVRHINFTYRGKWVR